MRRRVLLCLTLIAMSACNDDKVIQPTASSKSPTHDISDATHAGMTVGSNPDFFFLPPMVKNPSGSPSWNAGAFNPALHPVVDVCAYDASITTESVLNTRLTANTATCAPLASFAAAAETGAEQYQASWKVPSSSTTFYRISVRVGAITLGFADVETATNMSQLKNVATEDYIPLNDGRTLPIKFRVERYALCTVPGTGPCSSTSINTATGGTAYDEAGTSGVTFPAEPGVPDVTVTVADCQDFNPRVTDLRTFGICKTITTTPALTEPLPVAATVFNCTVNETSVGLPEEQAHRITMHQLDEDGESHILRAIPHVAACQQSTASSSSLRGMFADLAHGRIGSAARQLASVLAPRELYAARFIDLGGGGETTFFSDFQFALPAKMEIVAGDDQAAPAGTPIHPTVRVTDLGGDPVNGVTLHFGMPTGDLPIQTTGAGESAGLASAAWVLSAGANSLNVTGRGVASAGAGRNGPRGSSTPAAAFVDNVVDPFQPIQPQFPGAGPQGAVIVRDGLLTFNATGRVANSVLIYGPSLFTPTTVEPVNEQTLAVAAGKSVTVWDASTWASKSARDFGQFDAIIFADPHCTGTTAPLAVANANKATWSSIAKGPVVVIGTDPVYHQDRTESPILMTNGINYAASNPAATGLYVSLSCYYFTNTAPTAVDFLSAIGSFTVVGQQDLTQDVTIVAVSSPVMAGLTNPGLSQWDRSAHEVFPTLTSYPASFTVLATVKHESGADVPYILARP